MNEYARLYFWSISFETEISILRANCKHKNKSGRMASDYAKGEEILELLLGGDEELAAMEEVNLADLDESTMMKMRDENAYAKHLANVKAKGLKCPDCKGTG